MLRRALQLAVGIVCAAALVWAANSPDPSGDPVVGTWSLNLAKSTFSPGPAPKSQTRVYEAKEGGIKVTVTTIAADGQTSVVLISANYDGKDYPVVGATDYDAVTLKRVSVTISEATLMHGNRVIATARREVSADGKTMTITWEGQDAKNKACYDKQEE
jgi:hypothetical protein